MYVRTYVRGTYVRGTYVRTEYVTLRNVDRNVAGFLPANWVLFAARARQCENYNLEKQISGRARGAPGLAELSSYIWIQTVSAVDICLYRNSTIVSHSQRLGYKRAGPSGLAELEQLHVESNSECNRHVYLSSSLAKSLLVRDLISTWPGCACGRGVRVRQLWGYVFLVVFLLPVYTVVSR